MTKDTSQTAAVTLPDWLRGLIQSPPHAGEGVHAWLFRASRQLHAHYPAGEIVRMLESQVVNCGRHVPRNEIVAAVAHSLESAWQPGNGTPPPSVRKWPRLDDKARAAILHEGYGLADLWEASPVRLEDNDQHTEAIIDALFPGNPLLCCGQSSAVFDTKPREGWRGQLAGLSVIVPSAMSAVEGVTKDGKPSRHTLNNTGPRRFLVCEFDQGDIDEQAGILLHLATKGPLVCALHSGGKSLHGWFYVPGQPDDKVLRFFKYAVSLGADPATWTRSQFVRMPDGTRDNGRQQTVFFLHYRPLEVSR